MTLNQQLPQRPKALAVDPEAQVPHRSKFWNRRLVRVSIGLLLLTCFVLVALPSLTGHTSLDGTVNARFAVIAAPIEGSVTAMPPGAGTYLAKNSDLFRVRNDRISRTAEAQLEADLGAAHDRQIAFQKQRGELALLRTDLTGRLLAYQQASVQSIQQEIEIRLQRTNAARAQQVVAEADLNRKVSLGNRGIVTDSSIEQARSASVGAVSAGSIAKAELEQLQRQLEAVSKNIFVGEGRNDVPYSQQRMDEVSIQLADVQVREAAETARIIQLKKQLEIERGRNDSLEQAPIRMPFDGVIWRNSVVEGSNVVVGADMMRVLDCRELFVDILVEEAYYDQISIGQWAEVRLLGSGDIFTGNVTSLRGSSAIVEDINMAAVLPMNQGRSARVRVALAKSALELDYAILL